MKAKRLAFLGLFLALQMILSYVESLIPLPLPAPGMKLGLANLVTVFLLYRFSGIEAFAVGLLRVGLSALLFGTLFSFFFSGAGFLVSFLGMLLLRKSGRFSAVAISVVGGVLHNLAQIAVAVFVVGSALIVGYLPILFLTGILAGAVIGLLAGLLIRMVPALELK